MSRTTLAAAVVVAMVAIGGAFFMLQRGQPVVVGPDPTAEASASPSQPADAVPSDDADAGTDTDLEHRRGTAPGRWTAST